MKTVVLTTCSNYFEAEVIKGALMNAGIACMVSDGTRIGAWSLVDTRHWGSFNVLVYEDALREARAVLEENQKQLEQNVEDNGTEEKDNAGAGA